MLRAQRSDYPARRTQDTSTATSPAKHRLTPNRAQTTREKRSESAVARRRAHRPCFPSAHEGGARAHSDADNATPFT